MTYVPDPLNVSEPKELRKAGTAAAEFRAIKRRLAEWISTMNAQTSALSAFSAQVATWQAYVDSTLAPYIGGEIGKISVFARDGEITNYLYCDARTLGKSGSHAQLSGDIYYALYEKLWGISTNSYNFCKVQEWNGSGYDDTAKGSSAAAAWTAGKVVQLPDLRGVHIRGFDDRAALDGGLDPDRVLGSYQEDAVGDYVLHHTHGVPVNGDDDDSGGLSGYVPDDSASNATSTTNAKSTTGTIEVGYEGKITTETRVKNRALRYYVRYC